MTSHSNPMWVVCRNKKDNGLFITSSAARDSMVNQTLQMGLIVDSNVLKRCDNYAEAEKFKTDQEKADRDINNALNDQP